MHLAYCSECHPETQTSCSRTRQASPPLIANLAVGIPADLLRRRPDIRQAELTAAAQCAQIGFAKADLLPTFALTGNVGTFSTNIGQASLGDVFGKSTLAFSAGPRRPVEYSQLWPDHQQCACAGREVSGGPRQLSEYGSERAAGSRKRNYDICTIPSTGRVFTGECYRGHRSLQHRYDSISARDRGLHHRSDRRAESSSGPEQSGARRLEVLPLGLISTYRAMGGGWELRDGHDFIPAQTQREMGDPNQLGNPVDAGFAAAKGSWLAIVDDEQRPSGTTAGVLSQMRTLIETRIRVTFDEPT